MEIRSLCACELSIAFYWEIVSPESAEKNSIDLGTTHCYTEILGSDNNLIIVPISNKGYLHENF